MFNSLMFSLPNIQYFGAQLATVFYYVVCLLVGSCEYGNSIDVLLAISYFYKSLFCEIHEHYLVLT